MKNFKILVPIDFSDLSVRALHSAESLAALFDGKITPFHSYVQINDMEGTGMFGLTADPVENYEEVETALHNRLREIAKNEVDAKYIDEPVVSLGNAAYSITEEAKGYDLIVMSTHGRTGFTRFFLGSVSEKVLRTSHIPVLVVNKDRELSNIKRIMVTTDFSDHSKEAFPIAIDIARKAQAQVELIHILNFDPHGDKQPEESIVKLREQRLKVFAKEELHEINDLIKSKVIVSSDAPHEAILNYNLNNPHDLIIMSTVGRTGIDYLMMGSTTANVVRHVNSAVLSVNPKKKEELAEF